MKVQFHTKPDFYLDYLKGWLENEKKKGAAPASIAIVEDLLTLAKVALSVLEPQEEKKSS